MSGHDPVQLKAALRRRLRAAVVLATFVPALRRLRAVVIAMGQGTSDSVQRPRGC